VCVCESEMTVNVNVNVKTMPVMIFDGWRLAALFFPAKDLFFSDIIRK